MAYTEVKKISIPIAHLFITIFNIIYESTSTSSGRLGFFFQYDTVLGLLLLVGVVSFFISKSVSYKILMIIYLSLGAFTSFQLVRRFANMDNIFVGVIVFSVMIIFYLISYKYYKMIRRIK